MVPKRLCPPSPLRQHTADGHHLVHEQRLLADGGQGFGPLPLHQNSRVFALRPEAGVQGGTYQGCGYHHQGSAAVWLDHVAHAHHRELANMLTSASSPAAAVHQQFAIQFQTPTNQNAVYQEGAGQKGGRQRGCQ